MDISFGKRWQLRERQSFGFTADFFNLWSHANFAKPAISGSDVRLPASFAAITSTVGTPRVVQFSGRYSF